MDIANIIRDIFENQNFDEYDSHTYIQILIALDDWYFNDEDDSTFSFITDEQYDTLKRYAERLAPANAYFTGVGSDVRKDTKIKLPFPMGSLDQIYEGVLPYWVAKNQLNDERVVITDKLDGASGMVLYNASGDLQISFSRGNGIEGSDTTRHLRKFRSVPQNCGEQLTVRGEVIIEKASFTYVQSLVKTKAGKQYKNPRNCVSGLMNSKKINDEVCNFIKFVAYEIVGDGLLSKEKQLQKLERMGFEIPHSYTDYGRELTDISVSNHLKIRRQHSVYEIDGLVLDINSDKMRRDIRGTRDTLNPEYSVKYKVADVNNLAIATVVEVDWNISKHGYLKPRINIEPVELDGVTISYCTGFNANYIYENKIQPGCKIKLTRAGSVIPLCLSINTPGVLI